MESSPDADRILADEFDARPPDLCAACRDALHSIGRETVSFLLLDQFTVPLVGCDDHLEQFRSTCAFTTENTVELIDHVPAGGLPCPGCRLARHNPEQAIVPVEDGIVPILACPTHQADVAERYRDGLAARQQLSAPLDVS